MRRSPDPITVILTPLRTVSESNAREHWAATHRRAKHQRSTTYRWLQQLLGLACPLTLPLTITLTRIAPRDVDTDNLCGALKHVQDACADYLAGAYLAGQDRQPGLTFRYQQRRGVITRFINPEGRFGEKF